MQHTHLNTIDYASYEAILVLWMAMLCDSAVVTDELLTHLAINLTLLAFVHLDVIDSININFIVANIAQPVYRCIEKSCNFHCWDSQD